MTEPVVTRGPPRTRVEQRAATQTALLDATIASLVEDGYSALTTRNVAARAGVSQGAQQHHYPTKAALVSAALTQVAQRTADAVLADPPVADDDRDRAAMLVETLWDLHHLPLAAAIFELLNAARTDPEIALGVVELVDRVDRLAQSIGEQLLPDLAATPGVEDWLRITMATIRGVVIVSAIPGGSQTVPAWPTVRQQILGSLDALTADSNDR